ncbi:MAG: DUF4198 domain-containing protein [Sedimenticola sp.]|nr:DUF4198 domain-containing protein [Sedimenticola sp.]
MKRALLHILLPLSSAILALAPATLPAQSADGSAKAAAKQAGAHQQHRRGPKQLTLANADGALVTLWKPDLDTRVLQPEMGVITIPPTGMDNYHAVIVERDWGDSKEAIIRYEYMRGKPSGESPSRLASAIKTELEIVPDPIPREHYRYYAGEEWSFILRYKDKPVRDREVVLETSNGSTLMSVSDQDGRLTFRIPDDFPNVVKGERDRRSAEMFLSTSIEEGGVRYESMLTADYRMSPSHWQSTTWGVTVAGAGFLFGGFLTGFGRRKKKGESR